MNHSSPIVPAEGVVAKAVGDTIVLVHVASNRIFELNQSGARIWALVEDGTTRDDICRRLREEYEIHDDIDANVDELLAELSREGLIGG